MDVPPVANPGYRSKRGRVSRACDRCHARKVRCDDLQPTCSNCIRAKAVCTTSHDGATLGPVTRRKTGPERQSSQSSANALTEQVLECQTSATLLNGLSRASNTYVPDASISPRETFHNELRNGMRSESMALHATPTSAASDFHTYTTDLGAAVNIDSSTMRRQHMGSSSLQVLTQWLSITFAAYGMPQSFSSQFQDGMRPAVEMQLPMTIQLPVLPNAERTEAIGKVYLNKNGSIFPILQQEEVSSLMSLLPVLEDLSHLEPLQRPLLACLYALLSIGFDEEANAPTNEGMTYLQASYSMMPHIIATPYLPSVQALLLITIALLGRNKGGAGWHTLGQGIRMSYALGLHRRDASIDASSGTHDEQSRRIWWAMYCLERIMVAECGRPTMILDDQVNQELPRSPRSQTTILKYLVGLAQIQGEISVRLYGSLSAAHAPSSYFKTMAEIVEKLATWLRSLPEQLRPDQEPLCCAPNLVQFVTYLGFQYHQVIITLYRPALLFDKKIYEEQLSSVNLDGNTYHRLRAGESICVKSARAIVTLLSDALQQGYTTRVFTLTQPLLAAYVLAIQLIKHPLAWSSASDLKLLASTSKEITDQYIASGQTPGFCSMLRDLQRLAEQSIRYATASHSATPIGATSPVEPNLANAHSSPDSAIDASLQDFEYRQNADMNGMSMANFDLYQSLPFFFDHDVQNDALRAEDACHLFGLPVVGHDFGNFGDLI